MEDVGRIYREPRHLIAFVHDAVDAEVRVIAINDALDTAEDDWEVQLHIAMIRHGFAATDARKRVTRQAAYAFQRGGDAKKVPFGYRKLTKEEAASGVFGPIGLRLAKIDELFPASTWQWMQFQHVAFVRAWLPDQDARTSLQA